jgi:hypothetical protein
MDCEKCREQMDNYILGDLPPEMVEEVQDHLLDCPSCQEQMEWAREALQNPELQDAERKRHQASVLLGRKQRQGLKKLESPRMRMIKWILIGSCFTLVILGVKLRSDKFQQNFPRYHEETSTLDLSEIITATLDITSPEAELFFPLYEQARRDVRAIRRQQELNEIRIDNITGENTTAAVEELIGQRQILQQQFQQRRQKFYQEISDLLGSERAEEMLIIENRLWN